MGPQLGGTSHQVQGPHAAQQPAPFPDQIRRGTGGLGIDDRLPEQLEVRSGLVHLRSGGRCLSRLGLLDGRAHLVDQRLQTLDRVTVGGQQGQ